MIEFKRMEPGRYESVCGRIYIKREYSQQTYRAIEVVWSWFLDGHYKRSEDTLRDAKKMSTRALQKRRDDFKADVEKQKAETHG